MFRSLLRIAPRQERPDTTIVCNCRCSADPRHGIDSHAGRAWRNGRRSGLKIRFSTESVGSIPTARTTYCEIFTSFQLVTGLCESLAPHYVPHKLLTCVCCILRRLHRDWRWQVLAACAEEFKPTLATVPAFPGCKVFGRHTNDVDAPARVIRLETHAVWMLCGKCCLLLVCPPASLSQPDCAYDRPPEEYHCGQSS